MSIEVVKIVNKVIQPIVKKISVNVIKDGTNHIPDSIGLAKGDLIVFRGEGDPVRFSAGTASGFAARSLRLTSLTSALSTTEPSMKPVSPGSVMWTFLII